MLSHTSASKNESRYMVGGNGILAGLGGEMGWMARLDDEGWLFVGMVGIVVRMARLDDEGWLRFQLLKL